MSENQPIDSIEKSVLDKIRRGGVRRRPRWKFILRVASAAVVAVLLLICSALVISFILFSLHESGEQFLLGFGVRGIEVFLTLFPWVFGCTALALILLLEWLLQGFAFGYRIPLLNIFAGIVGVSIVLGILISLTPLHATLLQFANNDELPVLDAPYRHVLDYHEDQGVSRGKVVSATAGEFVIQHDDHDRDHDDGTFMIRLPADGSVPLPHVGDEVLVFGELQEGYIRASNIQILPPHR